MSHQSGSSETEAELKLTLSREDLENVFTKLTQMNGVSEVAHKYRPRAYYDTPHLDLYKRSLSLRVQFKEAKGNKLGHYEQTLKVELPDSQPLQDGIVLRQEYKNKIKSEAPSLKKLADHSARKAVKKLKKKKLHHIFTAAVNRRYFNLEVETHGQRGIVEVAFDVGNITLPSQKAVLPVTEIEIELKHGAKEVITAVKNEIFKIAPTAQEQHLTKAQCGTRFYLKHKK